MAGTKRLRPVAPEEKAPPRTVSEAAEHGSRIDELKAMRRIIAAHLDSEQTLARDIASLSRRQIEISREIEELEVQEAERLAVEGVADHGATDGKWRPAAI